jgi:hypothetical protein
VKQDNEIQIELQSMDSPLAGMEKSMPYTMPEGYFHTLPEDLLNATLANSIETGIASPYTAPDAYFSSLPESLLAAAKESEVTKGAPRLISFRPYWKRSIKWAAAAVLVLGIGFGSYHYMQPATPDGKAAKQLAKIDGDVIQEYVMHHVDEFDEETLENTVAANTNLHNTVSTLDDEEIKAYLDENGWDEKESIN